ncbi:hypothetical protein CEK26_010034 [Fusarium fujikuroi]|nr:hypothetical protein CEK27_010054 [Fusarium fujikuroi]QGI96965.1 hypothetical protein CEK26_010034 [Fusarium fujikuroi]
MRDVGNTMSTGLSMPPCDVKFSTCPMFLSYWELRQTIQLETRERFCDRDHLDFDLAKPPVAGEIRHGCKSLAPCQVSVCIQYCSMALCSLHIIDDEVRGEYHDWSTYSGSGKITKATSSNGLSRGMEANLKGSLIRLSAEPRHQNRSGFVARTLRKRPLLGLYPLTLASIAGRKPQTRPMSISPSCQKGSKVWLVSALRHRLCSGKETPDHPEC